MNLPRSPSFASTGRNADRGAVFDPLAQTRRGDAGDLLATYSVFDLGRGAHSQFSRTSGRDRRKSFNAEPVTWVL